MSIEDIILSHDRRGISWLRDHLPADFCRRAAAFLLDSMERGGGPAIITTGFYVFRAGAAETDGPPGAIALGRALQWLDFEVVYVTDKYGVPLLSSELARQGRVVEFPITDQESSRRFAWHLLAEIQPSVLVSVERCGFTGDHRYLNMAGDDITDFTASIDYLFLCGRASLGIGDGGNEIGMGNLARYIPAVATLPPRPALTPVEKLVIASVSNWGAYGVVAGVSGLVRRNLLPSPEWERALINELVAGGAVDGFSGQRRSAVDGFDLEDNAWALVELHRALERIC
ncbi:MAG: glutamate cyclase domain-containing protein [Dehalococcoidia bacterium]